MKAKTDPFTLERETKGNEEIVSVSHSAPKTVSLFSFFWFNSALFNYTATGTMKLSLFKLTKCHSLS